MRARLITVLFAIALLVLAMSQLAWAGDPIPWPLP